jgi:hypothetical protein
MFHNRPRPLPQTIGHYAEPIFPFILTASAVAGAVMDALMPRDSLPAAVFAVVVVLTLLVLVFTEALGHRGMLCDLCAAATPLDGGVLAERRRWMLRLAHFPNAGTPTQAMFRLALFAMAATAINLVTSVVLSLPPSVTDIIRIATLTAPFALVMWASHRHNRLRPWCPYCRWDGGGDAEIAPAPDPSPAAK